ncbi:DUF2807 domain-containing protein [Allomuricauda sp. d1]|uniref:GIN domain-containing protein n=1 Tax=Allomuricauda sp. d1 TaxID=3136725 RepID=UPI0031D3F57C
MKKVLPFLFVLLTISLAAQRKPKIKGNRVVTEVSDELPPFNAIILEDDLEITLKKSFGPGYDIEADDNLIDILKFTIEDSTLVISSFYEVTASKKFDIAINFTELNAITLKEGYIKSEDIISSETFMADVFGDSRLDVSVNAGVMDLNLEDVSTGDFNLDVDSLNVTMKKRADASIYSVSGSKKIQLQENADLELEGTTDLLETSVFDDAKLKARKLEAATIKLMANSAANVQINAFKALELSASGNSRVQLYGNPKITVLEFLDTTQLVKRED